jgi:PAT family beta-lactamase induction signal transducer AmpG
MIDITKHRFLQYFLFSSLYFSEGIKWSIAVVILPIYFDKIGVSPTILGIIVAIISLPMIIKFIFGGIVDYLIKYGRKRFVLIGGLTASISLFTVGFIDPASALIPFTIILFIGTCGIGILDVSADAWAIETAREEDRGKINGFMFAGIFIGLAFGSYVLIQIGEQYGYNNLFFLSGLIVLLTIIFPLSVKEVKKVIKKRRKVGLTLVSEFKRKAVQVISVFAPVSAISGGIIILIAPLYLLNVLNLEETQVGMLVIVFPIANIFGCIIWGAIADKLSRKKTLYIVLLGNLVFTALLVFADTWQSFALLYGIIGFFFGGYYAVSCALIMDVTNPLVAASQFSILTALFNLGELGVGHGVAGIMLESLGYEKVFLYSAVFYGLAILILYFFRLKKEVNTVKA